MVTIEIGSSADVLVHLVYHSLYITKEGIYHTLFMELCCKHKTVAHMYNHFDRQIATPLNFPKCLFIRWRTAGLYQGQSAANPNISLPTYFTY